MEVSDNPGIAVNNPVATAQRRVSVFEQININVFWIANNFHWQALLAIVIPSMVVKFLGNANKDIDLAMVVIWGTLVAFAVNPLVGAVSDYATFRMGRRRPFMIVGTIFNVIILVLFAFSPNWFTSTELLIAFAVLFLLLQFTNNLANSPWSAIIADKVPQNQRGITANAGEEDKRRGGIGVAQQADPLHQGVAWRGAGRSSPAERDRCTNMQNLNWPPSCASSSSNHRGILIFPGCCWRACS
ncbi:MAG: hypothetical protein NVS3B14_18990 [Ktedonobacteraceae bacterium]